jgi:hypothetical protein
MFAQLRETLRIAPEHGSRQSSPPEIQPTFGHFAGMP